MPRIRRRWQGMTHGRKQHQKGSSRTRGATEREDRTIVISALTAPDSSL